MSNWHVLVHEAEPKYMRELVTQMYPAADEQAAQALAERVAFEYRPAVPTTISGRSVFRHSPAEWTVLVRGNYLFTANATFDFRVTIAQWMGDRPS